MAIIRAAWVLLSCIGLFGCDDRVPDGVLRMGLVGAPRNLDPRFATDAVSERINRLLYRRLVEFDAKSLPVPSLAEWERLSPTHYRFSLGSAGRDFHNGSRLVAADVAETYRSILMPDSGSPHRALLTVIDEIRVLDQDRVDFLIGEPDPLFPAYLGIGILPAALLRSGHTFSTEPVGSGAFRFVEWPESGRLRIARTSDEQQVELLAVKDPNVRIMKLLRGEIHLLQNDLPPELVDYLRGRDEVRVESVPGVNFSYLGFNLEDPVTELVALRRALAYGIDRESILRYLFHGAARTADALFPPDHWAGATALDGYRYEPDRAIAELKTLGHGPGNPLRLVYKTSSDPFRLRLATAIQAQLARIGVDLEIRSYDWGTFFGDVKAGRFQLYGLTWVGIRTPDLFRYCFHSASVPPDGANRGRYRSGEADGLIETARSEQTLEEQAAVYRRLQALLLRDLPYIPLWYEDQVFAARNTVQGYALAADGNYDGLLRIRLDGARGEND